MSQPLLTWAALLARWMDFAKAALCLPADAEGDRWRAAVPAIIELQAVTFALGASSDLPEDERSAGFDRAEVLIRRCTASLESLWRPASLDDRLAELIMDAHAALAVARSGASEPGNPAHAARAATDRT